tara:strand:+ start:90765 stop:91253 length:489 start_codon:yes stop_codon:yes gene_type:complete
MMVYVAVAVGVLSFGGGYHVRDLMAEADQAQAVSFALAKAAAEDEISRVEEIELIKSQQKTKIIYKTITKEVPKYVSVIQKSDSECNLSHGTVSVFNRAALEQLPDTAGSDDASNTEPSTVKESDLIDYGLEVINQYNEVKNQCNALINWHKNVPQNNQKKD